MGFSVVVTFEYDKAEPVCVRTQVDADEPDEAIRKAVFRALPSARAKWHSIVVVLTRKD